MSITQKIVESTNVDDSTSAAIVGNTVLPAVADFGNGIVLYNEDCLQALKRYDDKQLSISLKTKKMKAIVYFKDGSKGLASVNSSYSRGGVHYYNLTLNALNTFLDFKAGVTKLFTGEEISSLTYTMS